MKAMHKRLGRLEDRYIPRPSADSPLVALLRARQRRIAEAEGRTYEEEPDEGPERSVAGPSPTERTARTPMNRTLTKRLDKLEERPSAAAGCSDQMLADRLGLP